MGKKRSRANQQKRRLAKSLKRKAKIKKTREQARSRAQIMRLQQAGHLEAAQEWQHDPLGFGFWACHGINFINSDYNEGLWDPVFPEIYQGVLPEPEDVEIYIYKHIDPSHPKFTKVGRTLMGYWFSGVAGMYAMSLKAMSKADLAGEDPLSAACPSVWEMFHEVHTQLSDRMGDEHLIEATSPQGRPQ